MACGLTDRMAYGLTDQMVCGFADRARSIAVMMHRWVMMRGLAMSGVRGDERGG